MNDHPTPKEMTVPTPRFAPIVVASLSAAVALSACSAARPATSSSPSAQGSAGSPAASAASGIASGTPRPTTARPTASTTTSVDPGAPITTDDGEPKPGLNGMPDPKALDTRGVATGPNLGDPAKIQPTLTLSPLPDSPVLGRDYSGAKMLLIRDKLDVRAKTSDGTLLMQVLDSDTRKAIKRWQRDHDLDDTGTVDQETWKSMFTDTPWTIDRYRVTPQLPLNATPNARIETMIAYMRQQIGAQYTWGAAGPKKYGFDCSGLMLQAMYAAGLDPAPINVVDHQGPAYPTAQKLYDYKGFVKIPVDEAKRGDMIFYGPKDEDRITHVNLFLGNGYVLESIPTIGVSEDHFYTDYRDGTYGPKPYAVRVTG